MQVIGVLSSDLTVNLLWELGMSGEISFLDNRIKAF
jgi:hypothetical protein